MWEHIAKTCTFAVYDVDINALKELYEYNHNLDMHYACALCSLTYDENIDEPDCSLCPLIDFWVEGVSAHCMKVNSIYKQAERAAYNEDNEAAARYSMQIASEARRQYFWWQTLKEMNQ